MGWTWRLLAVDPSDHKKVDEVAVEDKTVFWPWMIVSDPAEISGRSPQPKGVWQYSINLTFWRLLSPPVAAVKPQ